jgi:hypothetical protein
MFYSRSVLVLVALGSLVGLAGCAHELDEAPEDEDVESTEQAIVFSYGTIFNTGGDAINVRSAPNTSSSIVGTVSEGMSVGIECQINGTVIEGTSIWDFLPSKGGYVTDAYVNTGYDGFVPGMPICGQQQPPPPPPPNGLGAAIVAKGRTYKGYEAASPNCAKFSTWVGNPCVEWCGDYARYVWGQSGAKTTGLTGYSGTFRTYGINNGTWKSKSTTPAVGDAVVWGDLNYQAHVAIISEVSGSTFRILHGNYDNNGNGRGEVYETGFVNNTNTAGTGYPIMGYASPVPQ